MNRRNFLKAGLIFLAAPIAVVNATPNSLMAVETPQPVVDPDFEAFAEHLMREISKATRVPYELLTAEIRSENDRP